MIGSRAGCHRHRRRLHHIRDLLLSCVLEADFLLIATKWRRNDDAYGLPGCFVDSSGSLIISAGVQCIDSLQTFTSQRTHVRFYRVATCGVPSSNNLYVVRLSDRLIGAALGTLPPNERPYTMPLR